MTRLLQHVNAPRAAVYRALLDPEAVATWMVPDGMSSHVHAFDPREGGAFRISLTYDAPTETGKTTAHTDTYHGRFVTLVPDEQVVEVLEFETDDASMQGEMTVQFTLREVEGGTEVLAEHAGVPQGIAPADNELGWQMSLRKLARLVEADIVRPGDRRLARTEPPPDILMSNPDVAAMRAVLVGGADGETAEIVAREVEIRAAQLAADTVALDRLIAEDLLFTGPDGELATKAQDLEAHGSGVVRFREHEPEELRVRRVTDGVVVSALRARLAVEVAGTLHRGTFRYTRVWAREGGRPWRVVGGHVGEVRDPGGGPASTGGGGEPLR
ncbi:MAG TPA: SRPBCC domain-containing protein [Longimicrobiaceae bacterium]|nr:SRPBCC domain-containing protein [Longimicrobiaceae bacterium]